MMVFITVINLVILLTLINSKGFTAKGTMQQFALQIFLESSSARQSIVITDGCIDGINEVTINTIAKSEGMTILEYTPEKDIFETFLQLSYYSSERTNVLLLVSYFETAVQIFQQIIVCIWQNGGIFHYYTLRIDQDNSLRFDTVAQGHWTEEAKSILVYNPPLIKDSNIIYSNFEGRNLRISALNDWPFFVYRQLSNGTMIPVSGVDFEIITTIGNELNFTISAFPPADASWGGLMTNGSVTGMIGAVSRREAHLAIDEITITRERETVTDFTYPYFIDYTTIVSPSPKPLSKALAILLPYTYDVWATLILALLLIGPILVMLSRVTKLSNGNDWNLYETSFNAFRNLVIQGNRLKATHTSTRLVLSTWILFCLIVDVMYSSILTSLLAVPSYEKPINSLEEAIKVTHHDYTLGTLSASSIYFAFKEADSGIFKKAWEVMDERNFGEAPIDMFKKISQGKHISIVTGISSKVFPMMFGKEKFYLGKDTFMPQFYGIACPVGAQYLDVFSKITLRLFEAGIIDKWMKDSLASREGRIKVTKFTQDIPHKTGIERLTLRHLQGAFILMVIGISLAGITLLLEIFFSKRLV